MGGKFLRDDGREIGHMPVPYSLSLGWPNTHTNTLVQENPTVLRRIGDTQ